MSSPPPWRIGSSAQPGPPVTSVSSAPSPAVRRHGQEVSLDHRPGDTGKRSAWTRSPGDPGERSAWTTGRETRARGQPGPGAQETRARGQPGPRARETRARGQPGPRARETRVRGQPGPWAPGARGHSHFPVGAGEETLLPGLPSAARPPANTASAFWFLSPQQLQRET